jgi:hypothetical protein
VGFGALSGAIEMSLAELQREILGEAERDLETVRSSDRQNAEVVGTELDFEFPERIRDPRMLGSLWARLTALDAIAGSVISKAVSVSIFRMMPISRLAMSATMSLAAVPSVAVSKLTSL